METGKPESEEPRRRSIGLRVAVALVAVGMLIAVAAIALGNRGYDFSEEKPLRDSGNAARATPPPPYQAVVNVSSVGNSKADPKSLLPLGQQIASHINQHDPQSSVYIEDLKSGTAVHIGETKAYNIRSLMKLPLVMSLYRAAELGRLDLDKTISLKPSHLDKEFGTLWQKGAGHKLTLRQAAEYALVDSDNTAIRAINDQVFPVLQRDERA